MRYPEYAPVDYTSPDIADLTSDLVDPGEITLKTNIQFNKVCFLYFVFLILLNDFPRFLRILIIQSYSDICYRQQRSCKEIPMIAFFQVNYSTVNNKRWTIDRTSHHGVYNVVDGIPQ